MSVELRLRPAASLWQQGAAIRALRALCNISPRAAPKTCTSVRERAGADEDELEIALSDILTRLL